MVRTEHHKAMQSLTHCNTGISLPRENGNYETWDIEHDLHLKVGDNIPKAMLKARWPSIRTWHLSEDQ